jgi:nucleotide-binding universal stress UspA family protein
MTDRSARAPVVVGVPGELARADEVAGPVRWAAEEAQLRGAPLWLVTAYLAGHGGATGHGADAAHGASDDLGTAAHRAVCNLEHTAGQLGEAYPDLRVAMFARCGASIAVLGDIAEEAAVLVVGRRGHGRLAEAVLGSVTARHTSVRRRLRRVTSISAPSNRATSPVVVVPPQAAYTAADAPIVVGVDARGPRAGTLRFALERAAVTGVAVRLVHCLQPGRGGGERPRRSGIVDAVAAYRDAYPSVRVSVEVSEGQPVEVLVKESVTAGLLVLGPGRRHTASWRPGRLGPVGREVMSQAGCPVALLRDAGGRARTGWQRR